jgi:8-hydroxy-5-deazaflavin:NADPH oxidoreductase
MSRDNGFSRRDLLAATSSAAAALIAAPGLTLAQETKAPAKIGVIGSGKIGGTVGKLWVQAGHQVFFSSRHPEELKDMVAALGPSARAGTVEEAIAFGDAILLAVPYKAYPQVGQDYSKALAGKVVLDAGNSTVARDGQELTKEVNQNGIGVTSAKYFPGAKIVRAFNTLGYTVLAREAHRQGGFVAIPLAGDDKDAVATAAALVRDAGFDPVVVGGLDRAKEFQMGAPGYGQIVTAPELKKKLGLAG